MAIQKPGLRGQLQALRLISKALQGQKDDFFIINTQKRKVVKVSYKIANKILNRILSLNFFYKHPI